MRIGFGYDAHRLAPGRPLILCGVNVPSDFGPEGHSDADAPLHALADALLGAAALGDIGAHFPDTDWRWRGADSRVILGETYNLVRLAGYALSNADITIVLQRPKIADYIERMRKSVADTLGCDAGQISVKATTEESMGFTGSGEGISAYAVVLLEGLQ
ncbi:MAG: 2-C-methyl-D-erythritol 2,4-cyclodiphosphate synthase [Oscillospiraceae bacterium]|jgi:2-C-methyl-D-erythritol 2,4-cyclodiphosphate synthase|nr:2-C-methyl-D-erythritol 2,4-cyclodiphosphate synthase [Oscillospiraceae bacterium]